VFFFLVSTVQRQLFLDVKVLVIGELCRVIFSVFLCLPLSPRPPFLLVAPPDGRTFFASVRLHCAIERRFILAGKPWLISRRHPREFRSTLAGRAFRAQDLFPLPLAPSVVFCICRAGILPVLSLLRADRHESSHLNFSFRFSPQILLGFPSLLPVCLWTRCARMSSRSPTALLFIFFARWLSTCPCSPLPLLRPFLHCF